MRILLCVETYLPMINGVVTHVKTLREGLEALGHQVMVVAADPNTKRHYLRDGVLHCPAQAIKRFYNFGVSVPTSNKRFKIIEDFHPDIVHIHHEFSMGLFGMYVARHLDIPYVYTLHTMYDDYLYYIVPSTFIKETQKLSRRYIRHFAKHAAAITGPSQKCVDYLRSMGITKPVHVIPNAVEISKFAPGAVSERDKENVRELLALPENKQIYVFVGRLGTEKNVDTLLKYWKDAVKPEDNRHLLIVGEGPALEDLRALSQELAISDEVTFAGRVEHEALPPYLAVGDFYITASLSDTNSISMLEGFASGLPVLHLYDELNRNQVDDGINGFFYHSPEELSDIMHRLDTMPAEEMEKLRDGARDKAISQGPLTLGRNLEAVYKEALEIHPLMKTSLLDIPLPSNYRLTISRRK